MDAQTLNDILDRFVAVISAGTLTLGAVSLPLLTILATYALYTQLGPQLALGGGGLSDTLGSFLLLMLRIGFFYWLLFRLPDIGEAAYQTFLTWGAQVGGTSLTAASLSPGEILDRGFRLARPIRTMTDSGIKWLNVDNWPVMIAYSLVFYTIVLSFLFISLHLMLIKIEFALALLAGAVFIPWGVLQPTAFLSEFSMGWITGGLIRLFLTTSLIGIALPLFASLRFTFASSEDPTFYSALICGFVTFIFAVLAWKIPASAANFMGRGLALHAGSITAGAVTGARFVLGAGGIVRGASNLVKKAVA